MMDNKRKNGREESLEAAIARGYAAELASLASRSEPPPELVARALDSRGDAREAAARSERPKAATVRRFGSGAFRAEPLGIALVLAASFAFGRSLPLTARRPSPLAAGISAAWEGPIVSGLHGGFLAPIVHDLSSRNATRGTATKP